VKVRRVIANNRRKGFEVSSARRHFFFPYSKAEPAPSGADRIVRLYVDRELARDGFTYVLASGQEGSVLMAHVLEYNNDPATTRNWLLYRLTLEAQKKLERSPLSRRELIRRLGTSPAQLYRLLDQTNTKKSVDHMLKLLHVLECDIELKVRDRGGEVRVALR
jgi:hypothetical protein